MSGTVTTSFMNSLGRESWGRRAGVIGLGRSVCLSSNGCWRLRWVIAGVNQRLSYNGGPDELAD